MARTSSAKGWRPSYSRRAVRKRIINFIALGTYNSEIKNNWQEHGCHWDWAKVGMWTDDRMTDEEEEDSLWAARDWEEKNGTS